MGTACQQYLNSPANEIVTDDVDYDPSLREIKIALLKKICSKNDYLVVKPISNEEFNNQLKNKPVYYRIKNQLKDQLRQISFDSSFYQNVSAFKVTDVSTGDIQYYKGSFDAKGECCGEGIWLNNYNIYYGNFKDDTFNGKGVFMTTKGDYFFGDWINGVPNGNGIVVYNGMKAYEGEFRDGERCGKGVEIFPDGDMYQGDFANGIREGKGKYKFAGGAYYDGGMKNSKFDGEGVFAWSNGQKYNGQFNNGKMNGHGTFSWTDGSSYSGYYSNNIKQGEGEYKWANGSILQGNWINNKVNGNTTYVTKGFKETMSYQDGTILGSVIPEL